MFIISLFDYSGRYIFTLPDTFPDINSARIAGREALAVYGACRFTIES